MNLFALSLLAALAGDPALTQPPQQKARVMILGVYHFESPNLDYVKSEFVDHLSEKKQAEIALVLDRLAAFEPTKIVLEAPPESQATLERYQAFRRGAAKLAGDEREQLGFQLASQFDHPRVYLADVKLDMDFDAVLTAARESKDERFLTWFQGTMGEAQAMVERQTKMTVLEALRTLNEPALLDASRDLYLQLARVHTAERHVGAEVLASWYQRNFCIFDNVARLVDSPQERILVIFGQGHAPYLRELVRSSPDMEFVEPGRYLAE
jgi:uncharacterized protein DUF5694